MELLLQALALACSVIALAGPFTLSDRTVPRKVAFVFDTSGRMAAEGRIEKAKDRAREMAARLPETDELVVYWQERAPRRGKRIDEVRGIDAHVDVDVLLDAARSEAKQVVLFSDRAPEGVTAELFGATGKNIGIVAFSATDTEVFARIVNHGAARAVPALLWVDGKKRSLGNIDLARGETAWTRKVDLSGAKRMEMRLYTDDHFAIDDVVGASRLGDPSGTVAVVGEAHPLLLRALESIPGIRVRRGAGKALVSVVFETLGAPFVPGSFTVAEHPLTAHVRPEEVTSGQAATLDAPAGAEPLFYADGKLVAAAWGGAVHLSFELSPDGWMATPSFPIFWANMVDRARGAAASLTYAKAGQPFTWEGESYLSVRVGDYAVDQPPLRVNLLDARESDTAGETRSSGWDLGDPKGREWQASSHAWWLAWLALAFLLVAWAAQSRGD